jgi:hypothetical protein
MWGAFELKLSSVMMNLGRSYVLGEGWRCT